MDTDHTSAVNRARLLQFLYYFAAGTALPFFSLYFKHRLTTNDGTPETYLIGILFFVQSILVLFSAPVAGILGDKLRIHNKLISLFAFFTAAATLFIVLPGLPVFSTMSLSAAFVLMFIGMGVTGLFNKPIVPLIDTETLHALHARHGESSGYGTVRLFGSLGWTVSATLLGFILWKSDSLYLSPLAYGLGFLLLGAIARSDTSAPPQVEKLPLEHLKRDARVQTVPDIRFFHSVRGIRFLPVHELLHG